MDEIFRLVGYAISIFQNIESHLSLLTYFYYCTDDKRQDRKICRFALEQFAKIDSHTFGAKISKIKTLEVFCDKNDINVLEFMKDKRNYLAHSFFVKNKLDTENNIAESKQELIQIIDDANIIEKALCNMVSEIKRKKY